VIKTPLVKGDLVCRYEGGDEDPTFHNSVIAIDYPASPSTGVFI